jgi:hypothetical protein
LEALTMRAFHLFCFSLLLFTSFASAQERSPEKTISDFISALGNQDLSGMLECFAIDNYVSNGAFRNTALRMHSTTPRMLMDTPPENYSMYKEIGRQRRIAQVTTEIKKLYVFLTIGDAMNHELPIKSEGDIDSYIADINPAKVKGISVVTVSNPLSPEFLAQVRERNEDYRHSIGIDDDLQPVALVKSGNRTYLIPFSLREYGNRWYIAEFRNHFSDKAVLKEISEEAFAAEIVNSPIPPK